jgi:hypothetical protein
VKIPFLTMLAAVMALLSAGCGSMAGPSRHEPPIIAVRNSTGVRLAEVSVRAVGANQQSQRVGSVSPVPSGVQQIFVRPSSRPPMPKQAEISWTDSRGVQNSQVVSLEQILKTSTGAPDEMLVVIIDAQRVTVVLERAAGNTDKN